MRLLVACLVPFVCTLACKKDDRPPLLGACDSSACDESPGGISSGRGGSSGDSGATGGTTSASGGTTSVLDAGKSAFAATVGVFSDQSFVATQVFTGSGTVALEGANPSAKTSFTGGSFALTAVPTDPTLWIGLVKTSGSADAMPTITAVARGQKTANLAFVENNVMDTIVSGLSATQSLQSSRGHVILRFTDTTGAAVANIQVTAPSGATAAYDAGNSYTDSLGATATRGVAIVFNVAASALPGTTVTIPYQLQTTSASGSVTAVVASGTTTLVDVTVPN
jgi:hypothetical protein